MWLFTMWPLRSTHLFSHSTVLSDFAPCPPSLSGKYEVSIMVPLFFGSVTVPGGCRSQGCHGCPTRSAIVLPYLSRHLPQAHLLLMNLMYDIKSMSNINIIFSPHKN